MRWLDLQLSKTSDLELRRELADAQGQVLAMKVCNCALPGLLCPAVQLAFLEFAPVRMERMAFLLFLVA
jgi:hypothetical protein